MLVADDVLEPVARPVLVPTVLAEELLQGPDRHAGINGNRFHALLGDIRELAGDVDRQMGPRVFAREAVIEPLEELLQRGLELANLWDIHARTSINHEGKHTFAMAGGSRRYNLAL